MSGRAGQRYGSPDLRWTVAAGGVGLLTGAAMQADFAAALAVVAVVLAAWGLTLGTSVATGILVVQFFFETALPGWLFLIPTGVALAEVVLGRARLRWGAPLAWAIAYGSWAVASGFWTVDMTRTTSQLGTLAIAACFMLATAILVSSARELRTVLLVYVAAAAATGAYGLYSAVVQHVDRVTGAVVDPNLLALYEVTALPIALAAFANLRSRAGRAAVLVAVALIVGSIFASVSRGGLLALLLVVAVVLIVPTGVIFATGRQRAGAALACALCFAVAVVPVLGAVEHREATEEIAAGSGRVNEWRAAGTAFREGPLLGLGLGGFLVEGEDLLRRTPGVDLEGFQLRGQAIVVHSVYIGSLAELGIIGFILYMGLVVSSALALWRVGRAAARRGEAEISRAAHALWISLCGWAVASIFISAEFTFSFWMIVGLALASPKVLAGERPDRGPDAASGETG